MTCHRGRVTHSVPSSRDRPYVVVHTAVSLDGATTGFDIDVGRFYGLAGTWNEDVTLTGADTILAQEEALASTHGPGPAEGAPLLAVVDGRGRVSQWDALRDAGFWSRVVALRAETTSPSVRGVDERVVGVDRVDLPAALADLTRRDGAEVVRVDSGGGLTGALLATGLVDEVSLLVHPSLSGVEKRWYGSAPPPARHLTLDAADRLDGGLVWLRYSLCSG